MKMQFVVEVEVEKVVRVALDNAVVRSEVERAFLQALRAVETDDGIYGGALSIKVIEVESESEAAETVEEWKQRQRRRAQVEEWKRSLVDFKR